MDFSRGLESEVRTLRAFTAKQQAEFQQLERKYFEMYKSREEWHHYSEQLKISCKHLEEELKRRDAVNVLLNNNVDQLTRTINEQEKQIKSLMMERNSSFEKMVEYEKKLYEKESLIVAMSSTNLDPVKGAKAFVEPKTLPPSYCNTFEETEVSASSNIVELSVPVNRNSLIRSSNEHLDGFIFCLLEHVLKYSQANGNEVFGITYLRPIVELFCRHALDTMKNNNKLVLENEDKVTTTQPATDNLKSSSVIKKPRPELFQSMIRRASKKLKELDDTIRCYKRSQLINSHKQNFINSIKSSKSDELNLALDKISESIFKNSNVFQLVNNNNRPVAKKGILRAPSVSSSAHNESDHLYNNDDSNVRSNWAVVNTSGETSFSTSTPLLKNSMRRVRFNLPEHFSPIKRGPIVRKSMGLAHVPPSKCMRFGIYEMRKENKMLERKRQTNVFDDSCGALDVNGILYR